MCTVLTAVAGGVWPDRLGRRKAFMIASGPVVASALLLLAFVTTFAGAFVGAVILGIGFGFYTAVDFAMITEVRPSAGVLGLDLGYSTLYVLAAAFSVLGSVLVVNIKSLA